MGDNAQQILSLGLGGVLISLVGYSIFRLIGAWMTIAGTERDSNAESRARESAMQQKLNEEIAKRVALEVEVRFLHKEIEELRARLSLLEHQEDAE